MLVEGITKVANIKRREVQQPALLSLHGSALLTLPMFASPSTRILVILTASLLLLTVPVANAAPSKVKSASFPSYGSTKARDDDRHPRIAAPQVEKASGITMSQAYRQGSKELIKTAGRNLINGAKGVFQVPMAGIEGAANSVSNVKTHWKAGNYGKAFASVGGIVAKPVGSIMLAPTTPVLGLMSAGAAATTSGFKFMDSLDGKLAERRGDMKWNGGADAIENRMKNRNELLTYRNGMMERLVRGRKALD